MSDTLAGKRSRFDIVSLRLSEIVNWLQSARWLHRWVIPLSIFLVAFLLRAIYPVSRPLVWSDRSFHFAKAILEQDWATTYQQYHPGVSLMWLTGTGLQIFSHLQGGLTPDQMLGVEPTRPGTLTNSVVAGVIPLALAIALCIALTYPLLSRLAGRAIAIVAAIFLVFDPFFIESSKVIQPDALLSIFMLISALLILLYLKEERIGWLILSGVFAGLSMLSKTPSLFLIPYMLLVVTVATSWPLLSRKGGERGRGWPSLLWKIIRAILIWGGVTISVIVILWPALWVEPIEALNRVLFGIVHHTEDPHGNPIFFNNKIYTVDPGIGFYLATLAWKTTAITFPLILASIVFGLWHFQTPRAKVFWALVAYAFFFTLQMALGNFKQMSYILPTFSALSVLAAFGLVWAVEAVSKIPFLRPWKWLPIAMVFGLLIIQVWLVLDHFPYFGTHFNHLLGGAQVAQHILPFQDNGEGLDIAAQYLSRLPHGQDETATLFERNAVVFQREFIGRTLTEFVPWATYRVYYINHLMRGFGQEEWGESWLADQKREPLLTVEFDGVTYVWVYGDKPEDPVPGKPKTVVNYLLGESIVLEGFRLSGEVITPGDTITVVLYWKLQEEIAGDYTVFVHLLSEDGELVAQQDNIPINGIRPTDTWLVGEELEDVFNIVAPDDLAPGQYELSVGMYDSETIERLPIIDTKGNRLEGDRIVIGHVIVE